MASYQWGPARARESDRGWSPANRHKRKLRQPVGCYEEDAHDSLLHRHRLHHTLQSVHPARPNRDKPQRRVAQVLNSRVIGSMTFVFRSTANTIVRCSAPSRLLATTGSSCRRSGMLSRTVNVPSGRNSTGSPDDRHMGPGAWWPRR